MKKILVMASLASLMTTSLIAKTGFSSAKQMEIKKLETKMNTIEKRLSCVKNAKNAKELAQCKSQYKLINKKAKNMKNKMKNKASEKYKNMKDKSLTKSKNLKNNTKTKIKNMKDKAKKIKNF